MMIRSIKYIIVFSLLFFASLNAFGADKEIVLGGNAGWDSLAVKKNINLDKGRFGKDALFIASAAEPLSKSSDLLLDFENDSQGGGNFTDRSGNYSLVSSSLVPVSSSIMGNFAALGKGAAGGLRLQGKKGSLFGSSGSVGSFTLSFWLNPALVENGETIFSWRSSINAGSVPVYQIISAAFFNNRLEWNFTNVFANTASLKTTVLTSSALIVPDVWALHDISYNEENGLIEYRINGKIETIAYMTSTERAQGNVYAAVFGAVSHIDICPNFTGRIDDFSIRRGLINREHRLPLYAPDGGYFATKPQGPFPAGSRIIGIKTLSDIQKETAIQYLVRAGNNFYEWTDSYPPWVPVQEGELIESVEGIWFQTAGFLYADGSGSKSPSLTEVRIQYREKEAPFPPSSVFAESGDAYVDLSWIASSGGTSAGYTVYYGEAAGEYLGTMALEGTSPIDAGSRLSMRLTGLTNGKIYYFAVAAYSDGEKPLESFLSEEVYARPLRKKK